MNVLDRMRGKNLRQEPPALADFKQPQLPFSPEVASFIDHTTRQREELAWFKSNSAQLELDLKLANERIRMLEAELAHVSDRRDWLERHDESMLNSFDNIETLIRAARAKARADAYAQPGSGTQPQPDPLPEDAQQELAALVSTIKPGERDA